MIDLMGSDNPFLLVCLRCGHKWVATRADAKGNPILPKACANKACHSPYWNTPRLSKKARAKASADRARAYWEAQRK